MLSLVDTVPYTAHLKRHVKQHALQKKHSGVWMNQSVLFASQGAGVVKSSYESFVKDNQAKYIDKTCMASKCRLNFLY